MSTPTFPTDEQVEAAAKAAYKAFYRFSTWEDNFEEFQRLSTERARRILTAALTPEFIAQIVAAHSEPKVPLPEEELLMAAYCAAEITDFPVAMAYVFSRGFRAAERHHGITVEKQ